MKFCVECRCGMKCKKNGVGIRFGKDHVYPGDLFECPLCGKEIIVANNSPVFDDKRKIETVKHLPTSIYNRRKEIKDKWFTFKVWITAPISKPQIIAARDEKQAREKFQYNSDFDENEEHYLAVQKAVENEDCLHEDVRVDDYGGVKIKEL